MKEKKYMCMHKFNLTIYIIEICSRATNYSARQDVEQHDS